MAVLDVLFAQGLQRLYAAHRQAAEQTAANRRTATSSRLRSALSEGVHANRAQGRRLAHVFRAAGLKPVARTDPAMDGITDANVALAAEAQGPLARDLVHIAAGQTAAHFYLATYGTLRDYARALGNRQAAKLLDRTLQEAAKTDRKLTGLARQLTGAPRQGHHVLRTVAMLGLLGGAVALVRNAPKR